MRIDLAEAMAGTKPSVWRFPGESRGVLIVTVRTYHVWLMVRQVVTTLRVLVSIRGGSGTRLLGRTLFSYLFNIFPACVLTSPA